MDCTVHLQLPAVNFPKKYIEPAHEKMVIITLANSKGWMDELGFYVPSTVFQSFRDDGRVNMKGSVQ